jgi:hypothetical protein
LLLEELGQLQRALQALAGPVEAAALALQFAAGGREVLFQG